MNLSLIHLLPILTVGYFLLKYLVGKWSLEAITNYHILMHKRLTNAAYRQEVEKIIEGSVLPKFASDVERQRFIDLWLIDPLHRSEQEYESKADEYEENT